MLWSLVLCYLGSNQKVSHSFVYQSDHPTCLLAELLKAELPALYRHCDGLYLNLELMAGHWLLVYFINIFPPPVALRILEVSMAEGSDVTFAVALAFLRGLEGELLACDDLHELSQLVRRRQVAMYDADVLLHAAPVSYTHLTLPTKRIV